VIGSAEVIAAIPREAIREYYCAWYQPANMVTIVAGELEAEPTLRDVERRFQFAAPCAVRHPSFAAEKAPGAPRTAHLTLPLNVGYVLTGFLGPPSADLRATIALDVVSLLLGEGISSRLHLRLLEQLPDTPFFDLGSTHWTYRDSSNVIAYGIVRPEATAQALALLRGEIAHLHAEPPGPDELAKAVTRLEAQFAAQAELAAGLSLGLADSVARLNSPSSYTDYLPILHSLTPEELAACAAAYLPDERLCAVTVSPAAQDGTEDSRDAL
jgi:predicted Zn-dependent peptidase